MTIGEKQELLVALCGYLPYGVIMRDQENGCDFQLDGRTDLTLIQAIIYKITKFRAIPYLRPMSSMTWEEIEELDEMGLQTKTGSFKHYVHLTPNFTGFIGKVKFDRKTAIPEVSGIDIIDVMFYINWLNSHHFDYLGLIKKGLALEASQNMY